MIIFGLFAGVLLGLMLVINSELALETGFIWASVLVHGIGGFSSLLLIFFLRPGNIDLFPPKKYTYLGGVLGAFVVILSSLSVQSWLGVTGTVVLGLLTQIISALLIDHFGWLGVPQKKVTSSHLSAVGLTALGIFCILISKK